MDIPYPSEPRPDTGLYNAKIGIWLFLASEGVHVLSDYKDPKIMKMIGWALVELSKGEILDVVSELAIDVEHYLNIADLKTGSLFGAAAGIALARKCHHFRGSWFA
jgi:geranylgeranyl pyrophosphate synthase